MRVGALGAHTFPPARKPCWAKFGDWTRRTGGAVGMLGRELGLGPPPARLRGFWVASCSGQKPGSSLKAGVWRPDTQTAGVQASLPKSKGLAFGAKQAS